MQHGFRPRRAWWLVQAVQSEGDVIMPWSAKSFASRHNKKLKGEAASKAASQANALIRSGVPEGEAIAIANKHGNKLMGKHGRKK